MSRFSLISDVVLGSGQSSIAIPVATEYRKLRVTLYAVKDATPGQPWLRLNGDTGSNYTAQHLLANGSTVATIRESTSSWRLTEGNSLAASGTCLCSIVIEKPLTSTPARATWEVGFYDGNTRSNSAAGIWSNTADLITGITLIASAGDFAAGTRVIVEGAGPEIAAVDHDVRLVVGGVLGPVSRPSPVPWALSYQTDVLGGTPAEWGLPTLSPTDIDPDFGIAIAVADVVLAEVDYLPVRVSYDIAVDITPTAGDVFDRPNMTDAWDADVNGIPISQAAYRYQLFGPLPSGAIAYDSGEVASAVQVHTIGSGTPPISWENPQNAAQYLRRITVIEDGTADPAGVGPAISGVFEGIITTAWTPPPPPTGFTATAVTEIP